MPSSTYSVGFAITSLVFKACGDNIDQLRYISHPSHSSILDFSDIAPTFKWVDDFFKIFQVLRTSHMMSTVTQRETVQESNENSCGASRIPRSEKESEREETAPLNFASTIPDGGTTAWLQCAGSFSLLLNSFGVINSYGVVQILNCLGIND